MPTKFLVIGGSGYIGSAILNELALHHEPESILSIDRQSFKQLNVDYLSEKARKIATYNVDIRNIADCQHLFKDIDIVICLAGLVGDPACSVNNILTDESNILTQELCVQLSIANKVKRFVFASSASVYGIQDEICVEDQTKENPISRYARTKLQSEVNLRRYSNDIEITILRYSTVYGLSSRFRLDLVVNKMTYDAIKMGKFTVNGPKQVRPFVHVEDLARGTVFFSLFKQNNRYEIFNIGSDVDVINFEQLSSIIHTKTGAIPEFIQDNPDARNYRVNFNKASACGFSCVSEISESIENMVEFIDNFGPELVLDIDTSNYLNILSGIKTGKDDYLIKYSLTQ